MKTLTRRHFFKAAGATAVVATIPMRAPAPATLLEAGAGLCLVLTAAGAVVVCVVRLCRPRYILYFKIDEDKKSNGGREYLCLACSRAERERLELTKCQGPKTNLAECQALAAQANTNYQSVACGPIATEAALRASITLEMTHTPKDAKSWTVAAVPQSMDLNGDDPEVTFTVPRSNRDTFFRARADSVA